MAREAGYLRFLKSGIVIFKQWNAICLTQCRTNNNSFNKLEGSRRIWGHFSSLNMKINLRSSVLEKNTGYLPLLLAWFPKPNNQMPLPTVRGHCCPHVNPQSSTVNLANPHSFTQQILFTKCSPLTRDYAPHWGNTTRNTTLQASVLLLHSISAAYVLCELGQGPELLCT